MTETPARAILDEHRRSGLRFALWQLLDDLRPFMRASPLNVNDPMPQHATRWATEVEMRGPDAVIRDAMIEHPELWLNFLPEEVCIVPRQGLERLAPKEVVDWLAIVGVNLVLSQATRRTWEKTK